jgi:hypothetical protein
VAQPDNEALKIRTTAVVFITTGSFRNFEVPLYDWAIKEDCAVLKKQKMTALAELCVDGT